MAARRSGLCRQRTADEPSAFCSERPSPVARLQGADAFNALTLQDLRHELSTFREDLRQHLGAAVSDAIQEAFQQDAAICVQRAKPAKKQSPTALGELTGEDFAEPQGDSYAPLHLLSARHNHSRGLRSGALELPDSRDRNNSAREIFVGKREFSKTVDNEESHSLLSFGSDNEEPQTRASFGHRSGHTKHVKDAKGLRSCERLMGLLVVLNTMLMGYQAHLEIENPKELFPPEVRAMDHLFCFAFLAEILARFLLDPCGFVAHDHRWWNVFDTSLVALQTSEEFLRHSHIEGSGAVRLLRLVRLTRLVRLFQTFDQLNAIIQALSATFDSVFWMLVLISIMTATGSICILQGIVQFEETEHSHVIEWFGGMGRTVLTMFECIAGGVSWDDVARPLFEEVSPVIGILLCLHITFGLIFMMNLVTGIFVEQVNKSASDTRDNLIVQRITEHVLGDGDGVFTEEEMENEITKDEFVAKMQHPAMQEYLKTIDVPLGSVHKLFDLLDADGSGTVDREEIIHGCLSFRGNAKGLDVIVMLQAIGELRAALAPQSVFDRQTSPERNIARLTSPERMSRQTTPAVRNP